MRELKNAIERIVVTSKDREVSAEALPSRVRAARPVEDVLTVQRGSSIEALETQMILDTLENVTSNRREAAEILGISVRSLQYKLKKMKDENKMQ